MSRQTTTVLVVRPGRHTLRFELSARWPAYVLSALLVPVLMGAAGRQGWDALHRSMPHPKLRPVAIVGDLALAARPVTAAAHVAASPVPTDERPASNGPEATASPNEASAFASIVARLHPKAGRPGIAAVVPAGPILAAFQQRPVDAARLAPTTLTLHAVHFDEVAEVQPFDAQGAADPEAFATLNHLMRCRVTGEEIPIDPRLVRLLMLLSASYEQPIEVISGHRAAHTLGTSPTSQHVHGRAADIRIKGISIRALRQRAIEVGARGVGLYPEKGFVHVDVRNKARYYWAYTAESGELPYDRFLHGRAHGPLAINTATGPEADSGEME